MKKNLAIFLMVLLPLQFSWAAVTAYCLYESGMLTKHLGHHSHDHHSYDHQSISHQKSDSTNSAGIDHDCAACHCATALTSKLISPTVMTSQGFLSEHHTSPYRALAERPERPQWPRLA